MTGANYADSWVDIKGSGFMVADNVGYNTVLDGFQTHDQDTPNSGGLCGWGPAGAQAAGALGCNSVCWPCVPLLQASGTHSSTTHATWGQAQESALASTAAALAISLGVATPLWAAPGR